MKMLILSVHLYATHFFPSGLPTKILYTILIACFLYALPGSPFLL